MEGQNNGGVLPTQNLSPRLGVTKSVIGFFISIVFLLVSHYLPLFIAVYFWFVPFGSFTYLFSAGLFLFLNWLAVKEFGKNDLSIRRGLQIGYVLVVLMIAYYGYAYVAGYVAHRNYDLDKQYLQEARDKADLSLCDKIKGVYDRDSCYGSITRTVKNSITACNKMSDYRGRADCYHTITDPEVCKQIVEGELKDDCFYRLGSSATTLDLCQMIGDVPKKELCMVEAMGRRPAALLTFERCTQLGVVASKDECFWQLVQLTKDGSLCKNIVDSVQRQMCSYPFNHPKQ